MQAKLAAPDSKHKARSPQGLSAQGFGTAKFEIIKFFLAKRVAF